MSVRHECESTFDIAATVLEAVRVLVLWQQQWAYPLAFFYPFCAVNSSLPITRQLSTSPLRYSSRSDSPFDRPGPPPLPKEEQKEFNRLLKERGNQLQFNRVPANSESTKSASGSRDQQEELHPNARKAPMPDFEGETNPHTGEIGGPKKDPLQWEKEWTYGGRATDF